MPAKSAGRLRRSPCRDATTLRSQLRLGFALRKLRGSRRCGIVLFVRTGATGSHRASIDAVATEGRADIAAIDAHNLAAPCDMGPARHRPADHRPHREPRRGMTFITRRAQPAPRRISTPIADAITGPGRRNPPTSWPARRSWRCRIGAYDLPLPPDPVAQQITALN